MGTAAAATGSGVAMSRLWRSAIAVYSAAGSGWRSPGLRQGRAMCGVVGLIGPGAVALSDDLERMSDAVAHRGPDDAGRWVDSQAGVGLAHRRLSIVDLSPAGHQPMVSADGRWVLVLNGEVYDHHEHRQRLEGDGVRFRGHSDTEVLVELIARQGPEAAVAAVDGMFALGAWDRQERVLVLARDRLGEKPLYYGRVGGAFAFASELGAIRRLPQLPHRTSTPRRWGSTCGSGSFRPPCRSSPASTSWPPGASCGFPPAVRPARQRPTGRWSTWLGPGLRRP